MYPYQLKFSGKDEVSSFEASLKGNNIAALDEVGRGALAGPVVVACVVLSENHGIEGIADSKKISAKKREFLYEEITGKCSYGLGICSGEEVDKMDIFRATHEAAFRAFSVCLEDSGTIDYLLCDGGLDLRTRIHCPSSSVVKGDHWIEGIGAASIVAKVFRDRLMDSYHLLWPEYGFDTNKGYGTKVHTNAIKEFGVSPLHRKTFGICRSAKRRVSNS